MAKGFHPPTQKLLEKAYTDYHVHFHRERDAIARVSSFSDPKDQEIVAFLSALLAYGNVRAILNSIDELLRQLGPSPYQSVIDKKFVGTLDSFVHRFTKGVDIEILLYWVSEAIRTEGSFENFFLAGPKEGGMKMRLSSFVQRFTGQPLPPSLASSLTSRSRNLRYLLSDPLRGSACKRLNLFLRWVVRANDGIDLGLWTKVPASELMLPVDTHLLRILRDLRWTRSKTANWKVAEEATARLRLYCEEDPVKYDFALCHLSMSGGKILEYRKALDETQKLE